jgi:type I restriction enzyme S subunit
VHRFKAVLDRRDRRNTDLTEPMMSLKSSGEVVPRSALGQRQEPDEASLPKYLIAKPGDLIVNPMWLVGGAIGVTEASGAVSPDYRVFAPRSHHPRYLHYLLRTTFYVDQYRLYTRAQTTFDRRVQQPDLDNLPVPVPPMDQQCAIADYLDHETAQIDTLIAKQEQLIATLRERRTAMIDEALESSQLSTTIPLKYALDGVDQGVSPQAEAGLADEPNTWGVLKSGSVNRGVFRQEEHKRLPAGFAFDPKIAVAVGDVIVSRASGSPDLVGSCGFVERLDYQLILSDKLFRLRPNARTDPRFLSWLLNGRRYRTYVRQSISGAEGLANNLPLRALLSFRFSLPPVAEQRRLAAHLDEQTAKIDALIAKAERFIELSKERRAALITAAVTGQVDVRASA